MSSTFNMDEIYEKVSPMMRNYLDTKKEYKDCIVFYRLGDFYEMFFDDAITVSRELEITLTGKSCGLEERAPMCGVPFHACEVYLNKLVNKGYKVAICEQVEDPKSTRELVKREVVRIVTPGTNLFSEEQDETRHNYLMSVCYTGEDFGVAIADVSTGLFYTSEVSTLENLMDEIFRFVPSEIIYNQTFIMSGVVLEDIRNRIGAAMTALEPAYFDEDNSKKLICDHFKVGSVDGLGLNSLNSAVMATGAMLEYLYQTQKNSLSQITHIEIYNIGKFMMLDNFTRRNLELTETMREKKKKGSLLGVLDSTKTAMGARMLRLHIEQPSLDIDEIKERQDAVEELVKDSIFRAELREYLQPVYDLERILTKISYQSANPRDLLAFKTSLEMLPAIRYLLNEATSKRLVDIREELDPLEDICSWISLAICDEPPIAVKEGGIIRDGYFEEVDKLRAAKTEGKGWLAQLEEEEKQRTGIKNLRVRYNKVFGYYLEVTNSFLNMVPDDYMRKQTLTTGERFITPRLKELEDLILGAEDKLYSLEYNLFAQLREKIGLEIERIQRTANAIAQLDMYASLAHVAAKNKYVRPKLNKKGTIEIIGGRHPVIEQMMHENHFVENDTYLDCKKNRVAIITGPNMAGKSTYMRQSALIVLMAQIGSFVPAQSANIGMVDRIFTRVGASDDLSSGQSTFMVEMTEVANILRNATSNSLLILDEIGRGTSTYDGLSIAWAVIEYICDAKQLGAKTLFATHYHELTELEGKLNGVNNYCIAVKEQGDDIIFLRKIIKGGADKSYGIQVARLAGVPECVISRAKELALELEAADVTERVHEISLQSSKSKKKMADALELEQMTLFDTCKDDDILNELKDIEISVLTPIEAMNKLYELQNKLKNRW